MRLEALDDPLRSGGETGVLPSLPSGVIGDTPAWRLEVLDGMWRWIWPVDSPSWKRMLFCVGAAFSSGEIGDTPRTGAVEVIFSTTPSRIVAGAGDGPRCREERLGRL